VQLSPPAQGQTGWTRSVVWNFPADGSGGSGPVGLVAASNGTLFGTTLSDGAYGYGTVFEISP
jgi:uncharacterized repeat protein (TIGR03803 family)